MQMVCCCCHAAKLIQKYHFKSVIKKKKYSGRASHLIFCVGYLKYLYG